jgi:hypothetical protein
MRELEKQLLETRMTNARLMEDNESFQLLLGEKTLNGDLSRGDFLRESSHVEDRAPSRNGPSTSLADELGELDSPEGEGEIVRRLEGEVNTLKEQNKALTLYINKIIGRLLTHQGFESVLAGDDDGDAAPAANLNKDLPPPPPPKENEQLSQGFLQRAKTVAMGGGRGQKPRPISFAAPAVNSQHEDPATAPSIPLGRSQSTRMSSGSYTHRRSVSEIPQTGAPAVINSMQRTSTMPMGPTSPGLVSPRNSIFNFNMERPSNPASRVPSSGAPIREEGEDGSSESASLDTPSPPRGEREKKEDRGPMTGKGMRPLRLVQNEEEAIRARKAANRGSWFQGFFGQKPPGDGEGVSPGVQ